MCVRARARVARLYCGCDLHLAGDGGGVDPPQLDLRLRPPHTHTHTHTHTHHTPHPRAQSQVRPVRAGPTPPAAFPPARRHQRSLINSTSALCVRSNPPAAIPPARSALPRTHTAYAPHAPQIQPAWPAGTHTRPARHTHTHLARPAHACRRASAGVAARNARAGRAQRTRRFLA